MRAIGRTVLDTVYPRRCLLCAEPAGDIDLCWGCARDLPRIGCACRRCGMPLPRAVSSCGTCQRSPPPFTYTLAPFRYAFPIDHFVTALKFDRRLYYASIAAKLLVRCDEGVLKRPELLVPIPLHRWRHARRGFNQAEEIARALRRCNGHTLRVDLLSRRRATREQSRLDRRERAANVRDAFRATGKLKGDPHVGLVDDVITTGATMSAAARELLRAGAGEVTAIAFAHAIR